MRRIITWGGMTVVALLTVVWIGSGWWGVTWYGAGNRVVEVSAGSLVVREMNHRLGVAFPTEAPPLEPLRGLSADGPSSFSMFFRPGYEVAGPEWSMYVPLWVFVLAAAGLILVALRVEERVERALDRRAARLERRICALCGYERVGLAVGAVCPECGSAPV